MHHILPLLEAHLNRDEALDWLKEETHDFGRFVERYLHGEHFNNNDTLIQLAPKKFSILISD